MQRNVARAYDHLQAEHGRVRAVCIKILSQNDKQLERTLLRARMDDEKHLDEMLLYEDRLSRPEDRTHNDCSFEAIAQTACDALSFDSIITRPRRPSRRRPQA